MSSKRIFKREVSLKKTAHLSVEKSIVVANDSSGSLDKGSEHVQWI